MSMTVRTWHTIDTDETVIEVRVPRNMVVGLSRREFADAMYDLMVAPLDLAADRPFPPERKAP